MADMPLRLQMSCLLKKDAVCINNEIYNNKNIICHHLNCNTIGVTKQTNQQLDKQNINSNIKFIEFFIIIQYINILIYQIRYIKKKNVSLYLLPSNTLRLSHCPIKSERATQKTHTDSITNIHLIVYKAYRYNQYSKGIYCCFISTGLEIYRFRTVKLKCQVNAVIIYYPTPQAFT